MFDLLERFLDHQSAKGALQHTLSNYRSELKEKRCLTTKCSPK